MELEQVIQLIPTYGFPIVMCIYLLKHMKEERETFAEQLALLREVISENTKATVRLIEHLGGE